MSNQLQISGAAKIRSIQGPVVANSGVITALDGDASQYVRGDGTLADFPTSTGGGSSVSYYLNTSVSQGTIGGVAYKQLSKVPISGAGTDITISANGYIASYLTDANDPALLEVPAGNFNCEFYFSVNSNAHNPYVYAEVYKYDGTTFTLLGSSQSVPEYLTNGTTLSPYYFAIPVATSVLTITDRIAVRIFVNVDGRTVTLHTENNHLCQVVTTFSKGLTTLNSLTRQVQFFQTGTSGTDFNISSVTATHTFNIPDASASARGLITTGIQTIAGNKTFTDVNTFNNGLSLKGGFYPVPTAGDTGLAGSGSGLSIISKVVSTVYTNNLDFGNSSNSYAFPNASGTIALLSATQVFTGANTFTNTAIFESSGGTGLKYGASISKGFTPFTFSNLAVSIYSDATTNNVIFRDNLSNAKLLFDNSTQTYTFPAATGTLALTSDLSGYVTLATAQTISGDKIFTGINSFDYGINYKTGASLANVSGYISQAYAKSGTGTGSTLSLKISDGNSVKAINLDFVGSPSTYTYTFPATSGTIALLESNQTFTGLNTFSSVANMSASLQVQQGLLLNQGIQANALAPYTGISGAANGLFICPNSGTGYYLTFPTSSSYVYTFPAATGTIALTSNIPSLAGYVPYTGATQAVNLGAFDLTVNSLTIGKGGGAVAANVAIGISALVSNTTGNYSVAIGLAALSSNTSGGYNTAIGASALTVNITGYNNTAIGYASLNYNTGAYNTAIGSNSLGNNTTGYQNTAVGPQAGLSITTGSNNTIIGAYAGTATLSNNIVLADGAGNVKYQWDGTSNTFTGFVKVNSVPISTYGLQVNNSLGNPAFVAYQNSDSSYALQIATTGATTINLNSNASASYINTTANFGLGTASPAYKLDVSGTIRGTTSAYFAASSGSVGIGTTTFPSAIGVNDLLVLGKSGSASNAINFSDGSTTNWAYILAESAKMVLGTRTSSSIAFETNAGSERMRIYSNGNISIGTNIVDSGYKFYMKSTQGMLLQAGTNSGNYALAINDSTGASVYFNVRGDGYLQSQSTYNNTTASPNYLSISTSGFFERFVASSQRYKEEIKDWDVNGLDIILALRPRTYKYKKEYYNKADVDFLGLIAEEVAEVNTYLADYENEDGTGQVENVRYATIVVPLIKAVQEQQSQINELKRQIQTLLNK
jgi:hypothetical protein